MSHGPFFSNEMLTPREVLLRFHEFPDESKDKFKIGKFQKGRMNDRNMFIAKLRNKFVVVKICRPAEICQGVFRRLIIRGFFSQWFDVPNAVAYKKPDSKKAVMVMQYKPGYQADIAVADLSIGQKIALFVFVRTFGLPDMHHANIILRPKHKPCLIDLGDEPLMMSRKRMKVPQDYLPWGNYFFKNEINDYYKAIRLWQTRLSKRENLEAIRKMLKKAGFGTVSARKTMKIILNNSDNLIDAAKRDMNAADDIFNRQSRLVGMTASEADLFGRKNKDIAESMNDTSVANLIDYWVQIGKTNFSWKVLHFLLNQRSLSVMHNRMRYKLSLIHI